MHTDTIKEIETLISRLTPVEREELYSRLDLQRPDAFDAQIKADADAGRLDHIILEALEDEKNGRFKQL